MKYDFNEVAARHYDWVDRMGWHNKNHILVTVALIGSEIGEAAWEVVEYGDTHEDFDLVARTYSFGEELCDVLLRLFDLGVTLGYNLSGETLDERCIVGYNKQLKTLMKEFGDLVNAARGETIGEDFKECFFQLIDTVLYMCKANCIDVKHVIDKKIEKNEQRGNKGRLL